MEFTLPKTKICKKCGLEKRYNQFPKSHVKGGGTHAFLRSSPCFRCRDNTRLKNPNSVIGETTCRRRCRYLEKPSNLPSIIVRTARFKNKKRGWTGFDLDRDFVKDLIQNGCKYCEAKNIQMSLDRIDNNKGYTRDNVNPSCIRCNHIRGSMPYEAWREIYPSIRRAYELGLLSDWWIDSKRNNKPSRHVDQDASTGMKDAHEA